METVKGDYGKVKNEKGTAVTIGNFDGVHKGHTALIKKLVELSKKNGLTSVVYTFFEHPENSINGKLTVKRITDLDEKELAFCNLGIDLLFLENFETVKNLEPEEFVKNILVDKLNVKLAIVGENNRFGKNSKGDAELLQKLGEKYGIDVLIEPHIYIEDEICSSTAVRSLIESGNVKKAYKFLGRPFQMSGKVTGGKKLGRTYGFPTANIVPDKTKVLPQYGVYATKVYLEDKVYPGITNVGKTSFDEVEIERVETFLINYSGNLYDKIIKIEFIDKMRDFIPFSNTDELKKQLMQDKENRFKITEEKT